MLNRHPPKNVYRTLSSSRKFALASLSLSLIAFEQVDEPTSTMEYTYSPYEKSDPFNPAISFQSKPKSLDPLQSIPLERIIVVATLVGVNSSALVELTQPNSSDQPRYFTVKVGDRLGSELGTVIAIYKDRVVVRQQLLGRFQDPNERFQDVVLQLRRTTAQKAGELASRNSQQGTHQPRDITEALTQDVLPTNPKAFGKSPIRGARRIKIFGKGKVEVDERRSESYSPLPSPDETISGSSIGDQGGTSAPAAPAAQPTTNMNSIYTDGPFTIERRSLRTGP